MTFFINYVLVLYLADDEFAFCLKDYELTTEIISFDFTSVRNNYWSINFWK